MTRNTVPAFWAYLAFAGGLLLGLAAGFLAPFGIAGFLRPHR